MLVRSPRQHWRSCSTLLHVLRGYFKNLDTALGMNSKTISAMFLSYETASCTLLDRWCSVRATLRTSETLWLRLWTFIVRLRRFERKRLANMRLETDLRDPLARLAYVGCSALGVSHVTKLNSSSV
jgi:hypothetical protein